ncbi:MAG: hypothetical protein AAGE05_06210 [Pseudomonadota bacterium]
MTAVLRLHFTKGSAKYDWLDVEHADGRRERIDCPKQRIIPHDMVHYAVESTLDQRGFLGRLAQGEAASFRMEAEDESDGIERLVEVIQADAWSGRTPAREIIDLYRVTCDARNCTPLPLDANAIDAIRDRMAELDARWAATAVGETLTVDFAKP